MQAALAIFRDNDDNDPKYGPTYYCYDMRAICTGNVFEYKEEKMQLCDGTHTAIGLHQKTYGLDMLVARVRKLTSPGAHIATAGLALQDAITAGLTLDFCTGKFLMVGNESGQRGGRQGDTPTYTEETTVEQMMIFNYGKCAITNNKIKNTTLPNHVLGLFKTNNRNLFFLFTHPDKTELERARRRQEYRAYMEQKNAMRSNDEKKKEKETQGEENQNNNNNNNNKLKK